LESRDERIGKGKRATLPGPVRFEFSSKASRRPGQIKTVQASEEELCRVFFTLMCFRSVLSKCATM